MPEKDEQTKDFRETTRLESEDPDPKATMKRDKGQTRPIKETTALDR